VSKPDLNKKMFKLSLGFVIPGLTNTVTAVKNAQMAESPVLLMGGAAATLLKVRYSSSLALFSNTALWYLLSSCDSFLGNKVPSCVDHNRPSILCLIQRTWLKFSDLPKDVNHRQLNL
jgi:hypothetical protein